MSLIGWWKLDGDAVDSIGNIDGTLNNVTTSAGIINECGKFNGVNSTVSFGTGNNFFPLPSFSMSIWFKSYGTTPTTGTAPSILGFTYGIRIRINSTSIQFGLDNGTSFTYVTSPTTYDFYNDNLWHHVVITASSTQRNLYIDGIHSGVLNDTWLGTTRWPTNGCNIGRDMNDTVYYFTGLLDDFKIYNHVLSLKEVKDLSQAKILHYKMDNFQEPTSNEFAFNWNATDLFDDWATTGTRCILSRDTIQSPVGNSPLKMVPSDSDSYTTYNSISKSFGTAASGETWIMSIWVKSNLDTFGEIFLFGVNSAGSIIDYGSAGFPITDQWTRVSYSRTFTDVSVVALRVRLDGNNTYQTGDIVWWDGLQVEKKSYITPFVNGSRLGTVYDSSGYDNHATLTEAKTPKWIEDSKIGTGCYYFDGSVAARYIDTGYGSGINPSTNYLTISLWVKSNSTSSSYIYFSTNLGTNQRLYIGHINSKWDFGLQSSGWGTGITSVTSDWTHLLLVLDGTNASLYVNGSYSFQKAYTSYTIDKNFQIGKLVDATYYVAGSVDDIRVYATDLSSDDILELYNRRAVIDEYGNFYSNQITETKFKNLNLIDYYTVWTVGTSGTQGDFSRNGSEEENTVISGTDPFGKENVKIWKCVPDAISGADGGWNNTFTCDETKRYRMSVFIKRDGNSNGSTYLGCNSCVTLADVANTNPYFKSGDPPSYSEWYLWVGMLHPSNYTGSDIGISGIYDMNGNKIIDGTEFKMSVGATTQRHRCYLYYCTDITNRQYMAYPRVDIVDGNEPTIIDLVNGTDSRLYDDLGEIITTDDYPLRVKENNVDISVIDEVGPTEGLVGYWSFQDTTAKDFSGNRNDGTITGASITAGIRDYGYLFSSGSTYIDLPNDVGYTTAFSAFAWFKEIGTPGSGYHIVFGGGELEISIPTLGSIRVGVITSVDRFVTNHGSGLTDGEWHHVGFTFDGSIKNAYIDGLYVGQQTGITGILDYSFSYRRIGVYGSTTSYYTNGLIDDARIYNRTLSLSEVNQLYNYGLSTTVKMYDNGVFYTKEINETL